MPLEPMASFFESRLADYDAHMLSAIEGARQFYPQTAAALPAFPLAHILDLGCGTGIELEYYFSRIDAENISPSPSVTGIDLSSGMLAALQKKLPMRPLTLLCGSYFTLPLEKEAYDAAVSVESLHHFTMAQKIPLYRKIRQALKPGGFLILTDYFAENDEQELAFRVEYERLCADNALSADELYHYDTPLSVAHETGALLAGGFIKVEELARWGATHMLRATI